MIHFIQVPYIYIYIYTIGIECSPQLNDFTIYIDNGI